MVLGAGSFGTALADLMASNVVVGSGCKVTLWGRDEAAIAKIKSLRCNQRYLPDIELSEKISYSHDLTEALRSATDVLIALPSGQFSQYIDHIESICPASCSVIWACKGLEAGTGRFLSQVAKEGLSPARHYAVISGPSFAAEIAKGLPTAVVVAASTPEYSSSVINLLHNKFFRPYSSNDLIGVQLGGACKNVYAIAAGISDGLNFGANTRVAVITRGLAELRRLGRALHAESDTLMGLSGVGDLVLTCTDDQSRNRRFGLALAKGASVQEALDKIGQSVEGIVATELTWKLAHEHNVSMPIVEQVRLVVKGEVAPEDAVRALLTRDAKEEQH